MFYEYDKSKCSKCKYGHYNSGPVYDCTCDKKMGYTISIKMNNCTDFKEKNHN